MWPRLGTSKLVTTWLAATIAVSVIAMVDGGWIASWLALQPSRIWRGEVWRLVTWAFVELGPMSLVFTCLAIFKFGGELAVRWGDRRLRRFALTLIVLGAAGACLIALATGAWTMWRCGGMAVGDALVIAWARQFPDAKLVFHGMVTLSGKSLIGVTIGISVLLALDAGILTMAPELVVCLGAALYPRWR